MSYKPKTITEIYFSDIFKFATTYGIDWSKANDLFFGNSLTYKQMKKMTSHDSWREYVDCLYDTYLETGETDTRKALDFSVEDVKVMDDLDQSYLILGAFFETHDITGEIYIDCN